MEIIVVAIISTLASILLALIGMYSAKKFGLGVTQDKLVDLLKDTVDGQDRNIKALEKTVKEQEGKISVLEGKVRELTDLTVQQAMLIKRLMGRRKIIVEDPHDEISS